jgi:hypothetical protein
VAVTTSGKDKITRYMRLFVGGIDLSGDSRTFGAAEDIFETADMMGWSDTQHFHLSNRRNVQLTGYVAHMNDTATTGAFQVLKSSNNSDRLSLCFGGGGEPATGDPAFLMGSVQISDQSGVDSNAVVITADFMADASQYNAVSRPFGVVLQGATSLSATTTGSSHDNGASSASGARANLHITVSSGGTWAMKIQDSSDDSAWVDLITFSADGSAVTSEQGAATGTVDRYTRAVLTRTSGTLTAVITIARQ